MKTKPLPNGAWPLWAPNGMELVYRLSNAAPNTSVKTNAATINDEARTGVHK